MVDEFSLAQGQKCKERSEEQSIDAIVSMLLGQMHGSPNEDQTIGTVVSL